MRKLVVLLFAFVCSMAFAKTEIGELHGVTFRIDVPDNWNHSLVVYCHGYSPTPVRYKEDKLDPVLSVFTEEGYAVAQSAYSKVGWAVEQAVPETEELRKYFAKSYGQPKQSFITGHSMGGFLTVETMEKYPTTYDGGLALCGPLQPAPALMKRVFDFDVVFAFYFPGALPSADKVPSDFEVSDAKVKPVLQMLGASPAKAAALRTFAKLKSDKELAWNAVFLTYIMKDLEERSGGNPFSNRDTIYTGSPDDNRLNDGVKRYGATVSLQYLKNNYSFTGKLVHPVLAIHTTYDPLVPAEIPGYYALLTDEVGTGDLFVQEYVEHDGHCSITPEETRHGFDELLAWTEHHLKPQAGHLEVKAQTKTK